MLSILVYALIERGNQNAKTSNWQTVKRPFSVITMKGGHKNG